MQWKSIVQMKTPARRARFGAGVAVVALAMTAISGAPARASDAPSADGARMYVKVGDNLVDLEDTIRTHEIDLHSTPASEGDRKARLINLSQWVSCYTFSIKDEVFAEYTHFWDGFGHDVRLKCGDGGTSGWGYRHIEDRHKEDWQSKLDQARAKGWNPAWQGVDSWDDLMAGAVGSVVSWPEYVGGNPTSQTKCGVTDLYLVDRDRPQVVLMIIRVAAVWATNSDRLITAYPTPKASC
ncbi:MULTISPECIES: hypothetical protein [unclassified Leifsonia]|uniref:hypothetical protein n=1 Tax=unclassified Leifsonia TaxID=2663824 RepID=UPI00117A7149|nr:MULTISPECIES: hypothetical protein [unclassified Leifsonia]QIZ99556.1 hypothetical protein HF024_14260 [Leifsonia sp. PS1209]